MLRPVDAYVGQIGGTSASYPHGEAINDTVPGDRLGTPWLAKLLNDIWGFQQALVGEAGITPNNTVETAVASQLLEALKTVSKANVNKTGDYMPSSDTTLAARDWLPLSPDGTTGDRVADAALFTLYGTVYGEGDGATTFGLPPKDYFQPEIIKYDGTYTALGVSPGNLERQFAIDTVRGVRWFGGTSLTKVWYQDEGTTTYTEDVAYPSSKPVDSMAIDSVRNTLYVIDTDGVIHTRDEAGVWAILGTIPGGGVGIDYGICVNEITGSLFASHETSNIIYHVALGSSVFDEVSTGATLASSPRLATNNRTGDVYVTLLNAVGVMRGGSGDVATLGTFPGTVLGGIFVDQETSDVYVTDVVTAAIYKLEGGLGPYVEQDSGTLSAVGMAGIGRDRELVVLEINEDRAYTVDSNVAEPAVPWYVKT